VAKKSFATDLPFLMATVLP